MSCLVCKCHLVDLAATLQSRRLPLGDVQGVKATSTAGAADGGPKSGATWRVALPSAHLTLRSWSRSVGCNCVPMNMNTVCRKYNIYCSKLHTVPKRTLCVTRLLGIAPNTLGIPTSIWQPMCRYSHHIPTIDLHLCTQNYLVLA